MNKLLPEVRPVVRANGDSVVEFTQDGELVGEWNLTKIVANWFDAIGLIKKAKERHLRVVP